MPKEARITTIYLDKDNDDFLRCPTCPIKLTQFVNAKIREYRGVTEQPQQKIEIGTEATKDMNEKIANEIKEYVKDLEGKRCDSSLIGRCRLIKNRTGYDLTTKELKKLTEVEEKKGKGVQTNL